MKKLAIIGASYLQEPLVLKAKEMGVETHCFAWEDGATCKQLVDYFYPISILEKELILEKCVEIGIDGITSIASDSAVPTICFVAEKLGLISNSYNSALVATNKFEMRRRFSDFDVNSPQYIIANNDYSLVGFRYPLIVKPTDRSGSRGVMKVVQKDDIEAAVKRAQLESFSNQVIIEEFIDGSEISVESISWNGIHHILAITDKITTGEPYFVELEHHQPTQLNTEIQEKVIIETQKALTALDIKFGASHAEFKITESGSVFAIEVGARMGGDFIGSNLVQLSTGYDFVQGVIDIALGSFEIPVLKENKYSGVYFLSKETENIKDYILNSEQNTQIISSDISDKELHTSQCSADRSGYLIYQSNMKMNL